MPLKAFLAKSRRKSSGNVFDELNIPASPQEGSFRVLTRPLQNGERSQSEGPGSPYKSFEGGYKKGTHWNSPRSPKSARVYGDSQAKSASTSGYNDNSSSSARLSSSSTLPSSTDALPEDINAIQTGSRLPRNHPLPPLPNDERAFSVRAGGRTFSFGTRHPKPADNENTSTRTRGLTESSYASTATPPRLETTLEPTDDTGGFGDIFDSIGKSAPLSAELYSDQKSYMSKSSFPYGNKNDILASSPTPLLGSESPQVSPPPLSKYDNLFNSSPSTRSPKGRKGTSKTMEDEDAKLVMESLAASRALNPPRQSSQGTLFDSDDPSVSSTSHWNADSNTTTQNFRHIPPKAQHKDGKKIMTPAQFEKYKREKSRLPKTSDEDDDEDDEEDDEYDDEDETEKNRQLAKQRRQQEAHLSVYRQQMMKVTGESNAPRVAPRQLLGRSSAPTLSVAEDQQETDDEDEDIPLAILQAHGFPTKNRPPSQLDEPSTSARPHGSRTSTPSIAGDSVAGSQRHGPLPVFARGLPQDPYNERKLHTQVNRQSMGFGYNSPPPGQNGSTPGGLVGVIVGEERARAARRGSPNGVEMPPMSQGAPMGPMGHVGPTGQPVYPTDPNQLTQQMQQMMQFQMQWMEQMMQMQGAPPGQLPLPLMGPGMHHNSAPATPFQGLRPMSMFDNSPSLQTVHNPHRHSYAPSIQSNSGRDGGYAPSIAPSERSNVGMPSRYRPVSQIPALAVSAPSDTSSLRRSTVYKESQKAVNHQNRSEDEDDEEAWEELKKKKEKKKSQWKMKKENDLEPNYLNY